MGQPFRFQERKNIAARACIGTLGRAPTPLLGFSESPRRRPEREEQSLREQKLGVIHERVLLVDAFESGLFRIRG